ncbi:conserved hypothetical protein, partial [Ricinus communis]
AVGYASEAAFQRAFKRETGLTPAAWRAAATIRPPAPSAWSGAARMIQVWKPTGKAPKAKPHSTTAAAVTQAEPPAASSVAASTTISEPPARMARRSLRSARKPPARLPKKPPMP